MRNSLTRKARYAATVFTAAAAVLMGTATTAHAAPAAGVAHAAPAAGVHYTEHTYTAATNVAAAAVGWWQIKNVNSGLIMAVGSSSDANGAAVVQWPARYQSNGLPSFEQAWTPVNSAGYDNWRNAGTTPWKSLAIGSASKTKGAKAIQWTYETGHAEQEWQLILAPDGQSWEIQNVNSLYCLAIGSASKTQGAAVIQWDCAMHPEQRWILTYWAP